jgi:hypothetical protein
MKPVPVEWLDLTGSLSLGLVMVLLKRLGDGKHADKGIIGLMSLAIGEAIFQRCVYVKSSPLAKDSRRGP